jgi:hypothetical protein
MTPRSRALVPRKSGCLLQWSRHWGAVLSAREKACAFTSAPCVTAINLGRLMQLIGVKLRPGSLLTVLTQVSPGAGISIIPSVMRGRLTGTAC